MRIKRGLLLVVLSVFIAIPLFSRPLTLKIASLTPKGSPWDKALRQIASEWSEASDGEITLKIYPGGIAGDEDDMIRKMRFNQIQGGIFTSQGLNGIDPNTVALSIPFLITSNEEFDYVFEKVSPVLSEGLGAEGFEVIGWTQAGWIHIFSKERVVYPEDLKKLKMAGSDVDPAMFEAWKDLGFTVLPIPLSEIGTALSSGMVEACYNVLLGATAYQLYTVVDYMMDFPISPVIGAFVLSSRTWNRIDDELKPELRRIAQAAADELYKNTNELEKEALEVLKDRGVTVVPIPKDAREEWRTEFERGMEMIMGKSFSEKVYNLIKKHVEEFRK